MCVCRQNVFDEAPKKDQPVAGQTEGLDCAGMCIKAHALSKQGAFDKAQYLFMQVIQRFSQSIEGYAGLASLHHKSRNWKQCLDICSRALLFFPEDLSMLNLKAYSFMELGHLSEARRAYQQLAESHPESELGFRGVALACLRMGLWCECLEASERGLERNPENLQLINFKTHSLIALSRYQEALSSLDSYFAVSGWIAPAFLTRRGLRESTPAQRAALHSYLQVKVALGEFESAVRIKRQLGEYDQIVNSLPLIYGPISEMVPAFDNSILGLPK